MIKNREIIFNSFRNIGFEDGKPADEKLILNHSAKEGEIGDLVILIGANNSGKSNILDGINILSNTNKIEETDISELYMEDECRTPRISLKVRKEENDEYEIIKKININDTINCPSDLGKYVFINKENIVSEFNKLNDQIRAHTYNHNYYSAPNLPFDKITEENFEKVVDFCFQYIQNSINRNNFSVYTSLIIDEYLIKTKANKINAHFYNKYNFNFIPQIINYENKNISNSDLSVTYDNFKSNTFFKLLFNNINQDFSVITNAYDMFKKRNNRGILTQVENQLNKELKEIENKFNILMGNKNNPYQFKINLESNNIYFSIFRGEQTLSLNTQSTGFKWFFNFFFNVMSSTSLHPGDIIIMDEPATNLHPSAQKELRIFLKEFAYSNNITILLATHSPFLIDLNHLDELRIIENKDNVVRIHNNFTAVNYGDPDSLLPIKEALTVENYILVNPEKTVVFVEGITDYNYLTAFKLLFENEDIIFLPINGVGSDENHCKEISKRLLKIRKDAVVLVDNDTAGKRMKEINAKDSELKVVSLADIDENFKEIESLFSKVDLEKSELIDGNGEFCKHASTSAVFKKRLANDSSYITDETRGNFEKLFKHLKEKID